MLLCNRFSGCFYACCVLYCVWSVPWLPRTAVHSHSFTQQATVICVCPSCLAALWCPSSTTSQAPSSHTHWGKARLWQEPKRKSRRSTTERLSNSKRGRKLLQTRLTDTQQKRKSQAMRHYQQDKQRMDLTTTATKLRRNNTSDSKAGERMLRNWTGKQQCAQDTVVPLKRANYGKRSKQNHIHTHRREERGDGQIKNDRPSNVQTERSSNNKKMCQSAWNSAYGEDMTDTAGKESFQRSDRTLEKRHTRSQVASNATYGQRTQRRDSTNTPTNLRSNK